MLAGGRGTWSFGRDPRWTDLGGTGVFFVIVKITACYTTTHMHPRQLRRYAPGPRPRGAPPAPRPSSVPSAFTHRPMRPALCARACMCPQPSPRLSPRICCRCLSPRSVCPLPPPSKAHVLRSLSPLSASSLHFPRLLHSHYSDCRPRLRVTDGPFDAASASASAAPPSVASPCFTNAFSKASL